jgi:hypothetical protein
MKESSFEGACVVEHVFRIILGKNVVFSGVESLVGLTIHNYKLPVNIKDDYEKGKLPVISEM